MKTNRMFAAMLLLVPVVIAVAVVLVISANPGGVGQVPTKPTTYPQYGHAEDFSWVAGQMVLYEPADRANSMSGCAILRYKENDQETRFQLAGTGWVVYQSGKAIDMTLPLLIFGHVAAAGESFRGCYGDKHAPGYIVDTVQVNTAP